MGGPLFWQVQTQTNCMFRKEQLAEEETAGGPQLAQHRRYWECHLLSPLPQNWAQKLYNPLILPHPEKRE